MCFNFVIEFKDSFRIEEQALMISQSAQVYNIIKTNIADKPLATELHQEYLLLSQCFESFSSRP